MTASSNNPGSTRSLTGGAAWMVAARLAERFLGLASTMILARLLNPSDFGLVAMAMVFVSAADVLGAFGLDWALIRQPNIAERHLDTAWTIRAFFGVSALLVLAAVAYPASQFYREPRIAWMIVVLGGSLLVGALENPGVVLFRREMDFTKEFLLRTSSKIAGAVIAIGLALALRSYWALLLGTLAARLVSTTMSYRVHPHRPRFSLEARGELLGFSSWLWLSNVLSFGRTRIVELILGRMAGPAQLGLFAVSNELSQLASTELAAPINRAMYSAYATKGDQPLAVGESYLRAMPVIWVVTLPVVVGIYLTAPQVIWLMLGPKWQDSVALLKILGIAGIAGLLSSGAIHVYWAINRARLETMVELLWVAVLLSLVLLLTPRYGVNGAAWAVLAGNVVLVPVTAVLLRRYAGVSVRQTVGRTWRTAMACAAMAAVVLALFSGDAPTGSVEAFGQLVRIALVGAPVYLLALISLWRLAGRPDGPEADIGKILWAAIARYRSGSTS